MCSFQNNVKKSNENFMFTIRIFYAHMIDRQPNGVCDVSIHSFGKTVIPTTPVACRDEIEYKYGLYASSPKLIFGFLR